MSDYESNEIKIKDNKKSIGIVKTEYIEVTEPITLVSGKTLEKIRIAYEMYGKLNEEKTNVILICHALSGDAHAAGYHTPNDKKPGWWDGMIGPDKSFDTNKYCVICSNFLGSCNGTTGPSSINPKTNKPYGLTFPIITIKDMVNVQKILLDKLGIKKIFCVTGGSIGGMQVLEWAISYPDMVKLAIPIATTSSLSAQGIAFNEVGRQAIMMDPNWNNGNYYDSDKKPDKGLSLARMIGHITYLSDDIMDIKFARRLQNRSQLGFDFLTEFQVESYLHHQGSTFIKRFDANSYLYITKAMDYFDLAAEYGSLENAFANVQATFLVISFSTDWLFPSSESKEIVRALRYCNKEVSYSEIQSLYGHDAFLLEFEKMKILIKSFFKAYENEEK